MHRFGHIMQQSKQKTGWCVDDKRADESEREKSYAQGEGWSWFLQVVHQDCRTAVGLHVVDNTWI